MFDMADVVLLITIGACAGILGFIIGSSCEGLREHRKAVEAGVGHYVVNPTNGNTEFFYQSK